jgi:hypothetical protein
MIETFEVINEKDVQNFNTKIGKIGITVGHDLLGSPVIYVDYKRLEDSFGLKSAEKRGRITEEMRTEVLSLHSSGMNYRKISEITGISLGSITKIVSRNS